MKCSSLKVVMQFGRRKIIVIEFIECIIAIQKNRLLLQMQIERQNLMGSSMD
jgi:hypothetical protein